MKSFPSLLLPCLLALALLAAAAHCPSSNETSINLLIRRIAARFSQYDSNVRTEVPLSISAVNASEVSRTAHIVVVQDSSVDTATAFTTSQDLATSQSSTVLESRWWRFSKPQHPVSVSQGSRVMLMLDAAPGQSIALLVAVAVAMFALG
ncbi:uncharacterized protein BDZ99DRAFT_11350 [Mytilinidion resinicola]|uniref:Uncharacterized protein n=1 Tax=Mytilinidion resinicola TaxID=574789 RepID=A0A6A6Z915_9PEZI|nr:uncharacterized protein BDZ99DRAFT_11350 [Mytilinidion resinicola]KAF2817223.1 hypothetical protein BDZ99DRAFT_11350 [Mytilinidion resinicola]